MTGQALAETWRPAGRLSPTALLLGVADRFLIFALFDGAARCSLPGFLVAAVVAGR